MFLELWRNFEITRPSLHRLIQVVVISIFSFFDILANNRDFVPAIVSVHRFGFAYNLDRNFFFFAAILFFLHVDSRHGCNIVG